MTLKLNVIDKPQNVSLRVVSPQNNQTLRVINKPQGLNFLGVINQPKWQSKLNVVNKPQGLNLSKNKRSILGSLGSSYINIIKRNIQKDVPALKFLPEALIETLGEFTGITEAQRAKKIGTEPFFQQPKLKQTYDIAKNLKRGSLLYLITAFIAITALGILAGKVLPASG